MDRLHEDVRNRAVEIANQPVEKGMNETEDILRAVDQASAWNCHHNDSAQIDEERRNYKDNAENI